MQNTNGICDLVASFWMFLMQNTKGICAKWLRQGRGGSDLGNSGFDTSFATLSVPLQIPFGLYIFPANRTPGHIDLSFWRQFRILETESF